MKCDKTMKLKAKHKLVNQPETHTNLLSSNEEFK